ncbi:MAG: zinc ribbon domain-containing protein [Promethearchaeota archaeon]|nr:MAG: zinc ribbon domain-containing protein [Candidatus Lokiarchaeota archaeon]
MPRFCVYCGKPVKETDKFCVNCGKPLLSSLPKKEKKAEELVIEVPKEIKSKKEEKKEEKVKETKELEEIKEETEKEKEENEEEREIQKEIKPLSDEVKQQIEYYLELNDLNLKKQTLDDKLKELQKDLKSSRYDTDFEYGEQIDIQLQAVKSVMEELKQKETEIKEKLTDKFIVEKLDYDIDTKKSQLQNLVREHKLKKIKDKEVVKKLKEKYKKQLDDFIAEKTDLIAGIQLWIDELIEEKNEINIEKKFNKARFSAKEISEETYKEKDSEFEIKITKLESKIKTLEDLTKKKK